MSLKNMKMKGKSYQHHFSNLPQPLDDKLKAVEEGRWDELVLSHMRLGCTIAGRYVNIGANSDEMVSAAMLGICVAVDKIKKGNLEHDNVTGYIIHFIHQHCSEVLRKDTVVPTPRGMKTKITHSLLDTGETGFDTVVFEDVLEKIIETPLEGKVIYHRRQGCTDQVIAEILGTSQSSVTRTRHLLWEKYQKCC